MKRQVQTHGQHFLRGSSFIAELIGHSNIRKNDTVLDIGAGSGAITAVLAPRCKKVIAYENEPQVVKLLHENMRIFDNVDVVEGDFFTASLPKEKFKVFANIPFSLSSRVVRLLCWPESQLVSMYLIVQKQFAQKLITKGDHFHAALGMMIAPWWETRIRRPLRRTDFTPPPAVDTSLLEIKRREVPLLPVAAMPKYAAFVEQCYAEPRFYARVGGKADHKPSQLTLEQWIDLYRSFSHT